MGCKMVPLTLPPPLYSGAAAGTERVNYSEETMNQSSSEIKRGASMFQAGVSCPVLNDPGGGIVHRSSVCLGIVCHGPACSNRTSPAPRSRRKGRAQVRGEGGRKKDRMKERRERERGGHRLEKKEQKRGKRERRERKGEEDRGRGG